MITRFGTDLFGVPKIKETSKNTRSGSPILAPNIFTIPPDCDFLQVLVSSIIDGELVEGYCPQHNPMLLAETTIFVPNRRAARALTSAFIKAFEEEALLLPSIRTLGDVDDEDFGITPTPYEFGRPEDEISGLERILRLSELIQKWAETLESGTRELFGDETIAIPSSPADAILMAQELAVLLTQITQEEKAWSSIQNIAPENHAEWWKLTSSFLQIIMEVWPEYLKERGLLDPAQRAAELLKLRAKFYEDRRNGGPVIVAGSTGSVPSTQRLLRAVANLPDGVVVLPGIDGEMDEDEWKRLSNVGTQTDPTIESHPQYGLAKLLVALGIQRNDVRVLGATDHINAARRQLMSLTMESSSSTSDWRDKLGKFECTTIDHAFENVDLIEAANERQEATAIAIAMREVLVRPGKTAALVTPDRNLARRVSMELRRFDVFVDDTGGHPLKNSPCAIFLRLLVKVCFSQATNSEIVSLLKNPLFFAQTSREEANDMAKLFELVALRGAIEKPLAGEFAAFVKNRKREAERKRHVSTHVKEMTSENWANLTAYVTKVDSFLIKLRELADETTEISLLNVFHQLISVAENLATDHENIPRLLETEGAQELKDVTRKVLQTGAGTFSMKGEDFPAVLDAIFANIEYRSRGDTHPRLHIYGPLEVRLLHHDRVILAGLNEGTWPQNTKNDAFLNRTMRQELGMSSPERRTGLAAHDFQQLMGKREVVLSRASRVEKSPTVASRWVQRLTALIGKDQSNKMRQRGKRYLSYAAILDQQAKSTPRATPPHPKPPISSRPRSLPVTDIETWIRDPYALYAKRILGLHPLEPIEREADHLLKGTLYHEIMQKYVETVDLRQPEAHRLQHLIRMAAGIIAQQKLDDQTSQIWTLRFSEIAERYVEWEEANLSDLMDGETFCETSGFYRLEDLNFTLRARADRIEKNSQGSLKIIDYKTGSGPSVQQAHTLSPQLALEGLIAKNGGFDGIEAAAVADLSYMRLRRGQDFRNQSIVNEKNPVDQLVNNAEASLRELVEGYQSADQGYPSRRAPFKEGDVSGDYDHLARTREWSFEDDGADS